MNKYCVYKHECPNSKVYIGITSQNQLKRWGNNGCGYKNNLHFYNAILKYGWDNIKNEILFTDLTKEEACEKEIELIAEYKSNNPEFGYNQDNGGLLAGKHSVETKEKIARCTSEAQKGKRSGKNNGFYGKTHSEDYIKMMHDRMSKNNPRARKVMYVITGEIFPNIKLAAKECQAPINAVSRSCRGLYKNQDLCLWRYADE